MPMLLLQTQKAFLEDNSLKQKHKFRFHETSCEEANITF